MTTGEKLVEMSTLTTGTAMDHFLNIEFGGSGTDEEVIVIHDSEIHDMEIT